MTLARKLLFSLGLFVVAAPAVAQNADGEILSGISQTYADITLRWFRILQPVGQTLFAGLATIELAWTGIKLALVRRSGDDALTRVLIKFFVILVLFTVIAFAGSWIPFLLNLFISSGQTAAAIDTLNPSTVLDQGWTIAGLLYVRAREVYSFWSMPIWAHIAPVVVSISFSLIAAMMILTLVESFIMLGAGVWFLGFAGSRLTIPLAQSYLVGVVRVGVKLFVLYLLIAVSGQLVLEWLPILVDSDPHNPEFFWEVMGASIVLVVLIWRLPLTFERLISVNRLFYFDRLLED